MAKQQAKALSSVRVILVSLTLAFAIIGILVFFASNKNQTADIRSQASQETALQRCTASCTNPATKSYIKDSAKCTLDCTKVASGQMTCGNFCNANVKQEGVSACTQRCQAFTQVHGTNNPFSDVPNDHWAVTHIARVYRAGITAGCGTNPLRFCPDKIASRGEIIALIMKGKYNTTFPAPNPAVFSDVPSSHQFAGYIGKAYTDEVTAGCATDPLRFCPDSPSTRGEVARMFVNLKYGKNFNPPAYRGTFTDVPASHPHALMIEQFEKDAHTVGCSINPKRFCPDGKVSRAEIATFLSSVFNLP